MQNNKASIVKEDVATDSQIRTVMLYRQFVIISLISLQTVLARLYENSTINVSRNSLLTTKRNIFTTSRVNNKNVPKLSHI